MPIATQRCSQLHISITSGPTFAVYQLQAKVAPASLLHQGGQQQRGCQRHPEQGTSLLLPSPQAVNCHFEHLSQPGSLGMEQISSKGLTCTNVLSHIHQARLPEGIYHFWLLVQPSKMPELDRERSGLQPWSSQPSIPSHSLAAPLGQTQT